MGEGWKAIKLWQETSAKHSATIATQLQAEVVTPLMTFKKDQEKLKDHVRARLSIDLLS